MPISIRAGLETHWQVFGHGDHPALAIHCSLAHSGAWTSIADVLGDKISLTGFDMPGHGLSAEWGGNDDFLMATTRIAASFAQSPVDLIGHSFGALVALNLALALPEMVRTLTLIEPVLFAAARNTPEWDGHIRRMAKFDKAIAEGDFTLAAQDFTGVWGLGVEWGDMNAQHRNDIVSRISLISAGESAIFDDSAGLLSPGGLESLDIPVMLIHGDQSPPIIARLCDTIAARLPDVGVATVPGAGHMLPITHATKVAGLIEVNLDRG